ncbi:MAG: hypothetical protein QOE27_161 [Solirubrobacteraceae bacterium]|jgi:hypothetical protein|nr:hypothetical protein [Solirubrobacteraceae bacterium]
MRPSVNPAVRNVLILMLIAAAVVVLPGGGQVAALIGALLSIVFAAGIGFFAGRTYLERRVELYGLEDRDRAILYGAIGALAVTLAAASRLLATGPGLLALVALLGLSGYGLFYVYRAWRQY